MALGRCSYEQQRVHVVGWEELRVLSFQALLDSSNGVRIVCFGLDFA